MCSIGAPESNLSHLRSRSIAPQHDMGPQRGWSTSTPYNYGAFSNYVDLLREYGDVDTRDATARGFGGTSPSSVRATDPRRCTEPNGDGGPRKGTPSPGAVHHGHFERGRSGEGGAGAAPLLATSTAQLLAERERLEAELRQLERSSPPRRASSPRSHASPQTPRHSSPQTPRQRIATNAPLGTKSTAALHIGTSLSPHAGHLALRSHATWWARMWGAHASEAGGGGRAQSCGVGWNRLTRRTCTWDQTALLYSVQ